MIDASRDPDAVEAAIRAVVASRLPELLPDRPKGTGRSGDAV